MSKWLESTNLIVHQGVMNITHQTIEFLCILRVIEELHDPLFWVVIESRAWPTPFNFLTITVHQTQLLVPESLGLPFQFVCPPSLIDVTSRDGCGK
jgi:hypothetical protein